MLGLGIGIGGVSLAGALSALDVIAVPAPATALVFGADTPVGAGGAPVPMADGSYGEFAVTGGMIAPAVSPLTLGAADVEGVAVNVVREADLDVTVASDAELAAIEPHGLSTAETPDAVVRLRPGMTVAPNTAYSFGGGFPRPNPLMLHGTVTVKGEIGADGTRARMTMWGPQNIRAAVPGAGFRLQNLEHVPHEDRSDAALVRLDKCETTSFTMEDCHLRGPSRFDPFGDYGTKMDYSGATGSFAAGEKLKSVQWTSAEERTIMEVRDNGDGTGTLLLHDGTEHGQAANRARQAALGDTITGSESGAAATIARTAYSTRPGTLSGVAVTGNPRPDHVTIRRCVFEDLSDVITLKANVSITLEDNVVDRYLGDALTVSPNSLTDSNSASSPSLTIRGNKVRRPIALASDLGNPHADGLQINDTADQAPWDRLVLEFNQFMDGATRGTAQQVFIQGSRHFRRSVIRANIVSGKGQVNALIGVGDAGSVVHNNTVFRELQADGTPFPGMNNPQMSMGGEATYQFNIASQAVTGSASVVRESYFAKMDGAPGPTPVEALLDGRDGVFMVETFEDQFDAALTGLACNSAAGARGGPVDWTRRLITTDHLLPIAPRAAPQVFGPDDWTVTDAGTGGAAAIDILALPDDGGVPLTGLEAIVDGGAPIPLGKARIGTEVLDGLADGLAATITIRAVNAEGPGPESAPREVTPTAAEVSEAGDAGRNPSGPADFATRASSADLWVTGPDLPPDTAEVTISMQVRLPSSGNGGRSAALAEFISHSLKLEIDPRPTKLQPRVSMEDNSGSKLLSADYGPSDIIPLDRWQEITLSATQDRGDGQARVVLGLDGEAIATFAAPASGTGAFAEGREFRLGFNSDLAFDISRLRLWLSETGTGAPPDTAPWHEIDGGADLWNALPAPFARNGTDAFT